ncbi:MAG TPA: sulfite exporter TauE/SafE family protein [Candidatus Latescibacteria bacterium]|nr:sulfite exporter TauE/SafE family protein [Candidatus Latescibacterota bacterium]
MPVSVAGPGVILNFRVSPCTKEPALSHSDIITVLAAFAIGLSKTGFGGGLGAIVSPMFVIALPPREGIGLMLPLLIVGDMLTLTFYWRGWDRSNLVALFPGVVVGIGLGMILLGHIPDNEFRVVIGLLAMVFGSGQALRQWLVPHAEAFTGNRFLGALAGFVTGTVSAIAHQGGLVTTLYLLPQRLTNQAFVATSGIVFTLTNLTKLPAYVFAGLVTWPIIVKAATLSPAVILGALLGVRLNRQVPQKHFAWIVLFFVLVTGAKLVWDYFMSTG